MATRDPKAERKNSVLEPNFDGGLIHNDWIKATMFIKLSRAQRNAIPALFRSLEGDHTTLCYVRGEGIYELINNPSGDSTTDSDWELMPTASGSSLTPIGDWNISNLSPYLQDTDASGINGQFYFVTGAPSQVDVTHAGLFLDQTIQVIDGDQIVSVGTHFTRVRNATTWETLNKPQSIIDYENGTVIAHTHGISDITSLQSALDDKWDDGKLADMVVDFVDVPDAGIPNVAFLRKHFYDKTDTYNKAEVNSLISTGGAGSGGPWLKYWFVDPDNGHDINNSGDVGASPYATIGQAITSAAAGDIILLASGTYTETPNVNKILTLQGTGKEGTIINGLITVTADVILRHLKGTTLTRTSDNVRIENCEFTGIVSLANTQAFNSRFGGNITAAAATYFKNCDLLGITTYSGIGSLNNCQAVTLVANNSSDVTIFSGSVSTLTHNTGAIVKIVGATVATIDGTEASPEDITITEYTISSKALVTAASGDKVLIEDATDGTLKKADAGNFLAGGGDMLAATYDPNIITGDAFDMDNMVEGTTSKILTAAERTTLGNQSGTNTGDETSTSIAAINHAAAAKATPVDADEVTGQDSASSYSLIRYTWTNIKAFLKTYFDTLYKGVSDAPAVHAASHTDGSDDIQDASNSQKGLATASHVQAIEANTAKFSATLQAKTWNVDGTNGLDTNDGSEQRPFQTIGKAISVVSAGDTIFVVSGTYTESFTIPAEVSLIAFQGGMFSGGVIVNGTITMGESIVKNIAVTNITVSGSLGTAVIEECNVSGTILAIGVNIRNTWSNAITTTGFGVVITGGWAVTLTVNHAYIILENSYEQASSVIVNSGGSILIVGSSLVTLTQNTGGTVNMLASIATTINGTDPNPTYLIDTSIVPETTDKNYVTDAEKTVVGNTSGTNTGDEPDATTTAKGIAELATDGENAADVVVQGNDGRLSNARFPTVHNFAGSEHAASTLVQVNSKVSDATLIDTNDSRLSDDRNPTAHGSTHVNGTDDVPDVVGDSGAGGTKGLVPAPAAGDAAAGKYLKADGLWTAPSGSGDMLAATYDPNTVASDAFDMDNMVEGTAKILTAAERTTISNQSGTNTGDEVLRGTHVASTTVSFEKYNVYGTKTAARTGNILFSFTSDVFGTTCTMRHNDSTAPTLPAEAVVKSGKYIINTDNIIMFQLVDDTTSSEVVHVYYGSNGKDNLTATVDPAVGNDETQGYDTNSYWLNTSTPELFYCADPSTGAADWLSLSGAGAGGDAWSDPVDANIVPDADGTRNLGETLTRFGTAYTDALDVTNNIVVGGTVDGVDVAALASANTGDQTSIVGITGTKAQFDTAVTDGNIKYVGDAPTAHAASHQNGGGDEISVAGLSGLLADNQNPTAHASEHTDGTDDIQSATNLQKGLATAAHITAIEANTSHASSDGSDHTFIDQNVTSGSTPTLTGTNFTGIPDGGLSSGATVVSAGAGDSGKLVKLDADGNVDASAINDADIDHGTLGGLADDDHTQYHTDGRGDTRYYQKTEFISTSVGAGDSGKPVVLDAGGNVDASMISDGDIDHTNIGSIGTNTHAEIDTHIGDTDNPHLTDLNNLGAGTKAQLNALISDLMAIYGGIRDFGVGTAAQRPAFGTANRFWWATDALVLSRDTGTAWEDHTTGGATNLGYTASANDGTVTSDTGTDATIPAGSTSNASLMLPADKTKLNAISGTNTGDEPDATTTVKGIVELATDGESIANVVVQGNDGRLSDSRTPTAHSLAGAEHNADTLANLNLKISDATLIDTGDSRLSDDRNPTAHAGEHTNGTDDIQSATNAQKGLATASHITAIEANTAKDTNVTTNLSEGTVTNTTVDVNSSDGSNATLAAASTSRAGVMTKAKFDEVVVNNAKLTCDTANVTSAGALMDSEVDADLKTFVLPANTTISTFGASLVDDTDAAAARTTLDVEQSGTKEKSWFVENPTATDDLGGWVTDKAITITGVRTWVRGTGTPTVTFNIIHGTDPTSTTTTKLWSADQVANTTTTVQTHSTSYNDNTCAAGEAIRLVNSAVGGTTQTGFNVTIFYTID